jgi:hypothetical protein
MLDNFDTYLFLNAGEEHSFAKLKIEGLAYYSYCTISISNRASFYYYSYKSLLLRQQ